MKRNTYSFRIDFSRDDRNSGFSKVAVMGKTGDKTIGVKLFSERLLTQPSHKIRIDDYRLDIG